MNGKNLKMLFFSLFFITLLSSPGVLLTSADEENHLPALDEILKKTTQKMQS